MYVKIATADLGEQIAKIMELANHRGRDWSSYRIDKYIKKEGHDILVAIKDEPVGYVGVKAVGDDQKVQNLLGDKIDSFCQVTWLGVLPEHQKQGIARLLIICAEEWCRNQGKTGFWLGCRQHLLEFYEHLGLKLIGRYEEDGKIRYVMGKTWDSEHHQVQY